MAERLPRSIRLECRIKEGRGEQEKPLNKEVGLVPFLELKLVQGVQGKKVKCQTAPAGRELGSLRPHHTTGRL